MVQRQAVADVYQKVCDYGEGYPLPIQSAEIRAEFVEIVAVENPVKAARGERVA